MNQTMSKAAVNQELGDERTLDSLIETAHRQMAPRLARVRRPPVRAGLVSSPLGRLVVAISEAGIALIYFLDVPRANAADAIAMLQWRFDVMEDQPVVAGVGEEIRHFMAGNLAALVTPVDLSLIESPFQHRVMERLRKVPAGAVISYQALAAASGAPHGSRAVGNTMASNPVPVYVPCHRVIRSDGSVGNYGGGVASKLRLLRVEGFQIGEDHRVAAGAVLGHQRTHIYCRPSCSAARRADPARMMIFADSARARSAGLRACRQCLPG
ncbi:MAG TPA: methylated-DNA--[protein]-cysteine S-methyltransferase [Candidatus Binataceae bacterium]|jgi:methylated-DNA-[protein]-cysteine S-methyltransferase|nr:methylated-DNA--[protein]-cysteine S-methyltransferase [Candidatus Binataceae bacterium]